jgi:hypothetical protein
VTEALVPLLAVLVIGAASVWVYLDAQRCAGEGAPVVLRIGNFAVSTPVAWLLACVLLWVFFFPMYVVSRSR